MTIRTHSFATPLGPMCAVADEQGLRVLEFVDRVGASRAIERVEQAPQPGPPPPVMTGMSPEDLVHEAEAQLRAYFTRERTGFDLPLAPLGTPFQRRVWDALLAIPYGQTRSYGRQALDLGDVAATRAVARANGQNFIAIVIPCHRVIGAGGALTGYGGGLSRKRWLLDHEAGVLF